MSLDFETAINAITARFDVQIEQGQSVVVQYDNDGATEKPNEAKWINFKVLPAQSALMNLGYGNRRFRTPGVFVAEINVIQGKGLKEAYELADAITTAFRGETYSNIHYRTPYITSVGKFDRFYQVNVSCEFYFDDLE